MKIKSKVLGLILVSVISFGVAGCSNTNNNASSQSQEQSTDEAFIKDFETAVNKRWDEQDKLDKKAETNTSYTDAQYVEDTIKILQKEITTLEKNYEGIKDKELKEIATNYIEGCKKQLEANKTEDVELMYKYIEESETLRKPSLIAMVDNYGVKINDEHQQTYKDFKEKATVINKENEAQAYADKLGSEMIFEKSNDEFGDIIFNSIVENTSEIDYKTLSYKVQYKDNDGVVVADDYIYLENFAPGSKQKVELTPYEDNVETVVITTDWFETN